MVIGAKAMDLSAVSQALYGFFPLTLQQQPGITGFPTIISHPILGWLIFYLSNLCITRIPESLRTLKGLKAQRSNLHCQNQPLKDYLAASPIRSSQWAVLQRFLNRGAQFELPFCLQNVSCVNCDALVIKFRISCGIIFGYWLDVYLVREPVTWFLDDYWVVGWQLRCVSTRENHHE